MAQGHSINGEPASIAKQRWHLVVARLRFTTVAYAGSRRRSFRSADASSRSTTTPRPAPGICSTRATPLSPQAFHSFSTFSTLSGFRARGPPARVSKPSSSSRTTANLPRSGSHALTFPIRPFFPGSDLRPLRVTSQPTRLSSTAASPSLMCALWRKSGGTDSVRIAMASLNSGRDDSCVIIRFAASRGSRLIQSPCNSTSITALRSCSWTILAGRSMANRDWQSRRRARDSVKLRCSIRRSWSPRAPRCW